MTSLGERQLEDLYSKLAMDEDHEVRDSGSTVMLSLIWTVIVSRHLKNQATAAKS